METSFQALGPKAWHVPVAVVGKNVFKITNHFGIFAFLVLRKLLYS